MRQSAEQLIREAEETGKFLSPEDRTGRMAREIGVLRAIVVSLCTALNSLTNQDVYRDPRSRWLDTEVEDLPVLLEIDYEKGDPGVHTFPNGDPGYPPTPASVAISYVYIAGYRIDDFESVFTGGLHERWVRYAEEQIEAEELEAAENRQAGEEE